MCHEYGSRWWKSDKTTSARTEDAKPETKATIAALEERTAKPAPQKQVDEQAEEKELVPAE